MTARPALILMVFAQTCGAALSQAQSPNMIGNVGRDAGTLVFKGKFETADLITGEVEFSPLVGDRPSKHGTFKAIRAGGG